MDNAAESVGTDLSSVKDFHGIPSDGPDRVLQSYRSPGYIPSLSSMGHISRPSPENASESVPNPLVFLNERYQSVRGDSGSKILEEIEGVDGYKRQPYPTEEGQKEEQVDVTEKFYLFRVPYLGDQISNEIKLAQLQVEEKTRIREAIRLKMQSKKDSCRDLLAKLNAAKSKEKAAKNAFHIKCDKTGYMQTEKKKMKTAAFIENIGERIEKMKFRQEHETMPLKDEIQLLHEMRRLKKQREKLLETLGMMAVTPATSYQRKQTEESVTALKLERDAAKDKMTQAEELTKEAEKIYLDEVKALQELKGQFSAADDVRQKAYSHCQKLRRQQYGANKYLSKFTEDRKKAQDLRGDRDETPPVHHTAIQGKVGNAVVVSEDTNSTSLGSLGAQVGDANSALNLEHKNPKENIKSIVNLEQKAATKSKKAARAQKGTEHKEGTDEKAEVNKRTLEDEELARKEEDLRKEAAAKLKELRRSEEMAKAKEADERKKRNAMKAQARAEFKAQKEAELKDKEREKKARRKERKRAAAVASADGAVDGKEFNQPEYEVEEKTTGVAKSQRRMPSILEKERRPFLAQLRKRRSNRMQPWMWTLALVLLTVMVLYFVGVQWLD
ncbi:hypothetical protein Sjap_016613 [Stephania japonica]|uniref:Uncharacterized protein n=1 Tax=Stephania japonica TaxID=461633 RepID=A0AAP0ILC0_9MAGN